MRFLPFLAALVVVGVAGFAIASVLSGPWLLVALFALVAAWTVLVLTLLVRSRKPPPPPVLGYVERERIHW